jgi:hypothetical protein
LADLGDDRAKDNIKADIRSRFERFRRLAEFSDHHAREDRKLSLKEWVRSESVLVLGQDPEPSSILDDLNRTIMQRLQAILLSREYNPPSTTSRTALILDEFSGFADKHSLQKLLLEGRSYGLFTLVAFQTRHSLVSAYGVDADVDTLTSQLGNIMILRLLDPKDGEWAAKMLGTYTLDFQRTVQYDDRGRKTGSTEPIGGPRQEDYFFSPSDVRNLRAGGPIYGFSRSALHQEPFSFELHWGKLSKYRACSEEVPAYDFFTSEWKPDPWDRGRIEAALAKHGAIRIPSQPESQTSDPNSTQDVLTQLRRFQQKRPS